jgi:esterase/lipase superfamily enzyme
MLTCTFLSTPGSRLLTLCSAFCLIGMNSCSSPKLSPSLPQDEHPTASRPAPPPPPAKAPAPEGNYGVVQVFYATDRKPSGSKEPNKMYGGERLEDESLLLGTVEVSIPRDHKMAEIERPSFGGRSKFEKTRKNTLFSWAFRPSQKINSSPRLRQR